MYVKRKVSALTTVVFLVSELLLQEAVVTINSLIPFKLTTVFPGVFIRIILSQTF